VFLIRYFQGELPGLFAIPAGVGDILWTASTSGWQATRKIEVSSELFLIPSAQHFVQLDEPEQVARLILAMPRAG